MDEKTIQRIKKLQALAERGVGGEKTTAQKIEIELEFEFYRNVFYEELSTFMDAFIQAQKIFPEDAPVGDYDEFNERDMKIAFMATGIERRSRAAMIEESEAGNEKTKTTDS